MDKRVAIIGAGVSGLLSCKYTIQKGFDPVVFEAEEGIGGLWNHTIDSTRLQNPKEAYQFSDFPWPNSVTDPLPSHTQVMEYLRSYAKHFDLYKYINFNSKVISIDYVGEPNEEMESWNQWGGTGKPFSSKGKWLVEVQDIKREVYQFDFVIICTGNFSGLANIPEFPPNQGPEVFNGKVLHSMEYSAMNKTSAEELIKEKRVAVIGSQKSAVDIAAECANANGNQNPCTMIGRSAHWFRPCYLIWGVDVRYFYHNRFSELLLHKPGQTFMYSLLSTLLSPLRWGISKFVESYLRWKLPLKRYDMIPDHSFSVNIYSCQMALLPENFYDKVEEGSIILKKTQNFSFCESGLIIDGNTKPLETDVVILATGYKGGQKLKNIFKSPIFQKTIKKSPNSPVLLYRQMIHPRIPQLATIGTVGYSSLPHFEIKVQWLAHFLEGNIALPNIRDMEKDIMLWEKHINKYTGRYSWKGCSAIHIWYNDQLCKDMGCKYKRKKGFFSEMFEPYGGKDYAGLLQEATRMNSCGDFLKYSTSLSLFS